jgi:hypothetical protein
MFQFIKDLRTNSGLGRDENGWPTADHRWWEDATEVLLYAIGLFIYGLIFIDHFLT